MTAGPYCILLALAVMSCATPAVGSPAPPHAIGERLTSLIADHRAHTANVPGEILTVVTPELRWTGATGTADGKRTPLTVSHVFRIASVTKPFTAAAILRLMEMRKLDIERPIASYISEDSTALLREGGYDPALITVQQLLSHSSGIYDYASDSRFAERVRAEPAHQWSRREQIGFAMMHGRPLAAPGREYHYSDTGYVLLGEILERQTGMPLGKAVRSLLRFHKLGLDDTYWEQQEQPRRHAAFTGNHLGELDLSAANPSFDLYGGGGLISSTRDLATFYRALVRGDVFDQRKTLAVMMTATGAARGPGDSGVHTNALQLIRAGRWKCWGHAGFWGQLVAYCPENDMTFAWTFNQSDESDAGLQRFSDTLAEIVAP